MANKDFAVEINGLSYKYQGSKNWVLQNINLNIPNGSFYILTGPSGSGKSTLLTLMRGFQQEIGGGLKGNISVFGKDIKKTSIADLGKYIGIVFQNPALQLHQLRVIDEVASAPMYQGLPYGQCIKRANHLIDTLVGRDLSNLSPHELSAGQQQKVALAASLSLDAEILLLDEPFSFLDEKSDAEFMEILKKLNKQGKTIIVATHDIGQVANLSTEVGLMHNGELVLSGKPKEVLYSKKLAGIIPPLIFVQAVSKLKLRKKSLSWENLISKIDIKKTIETNKKDFKKEVKLSLNNISFHYPETKKGIENINLDIFEKEILTLIGANGSGKTTLAKIILGLLKAQKGKIFLDREDITKVPIEKRAKDIGYSTQDPLDMFFEMNLLDEVAAGPKFLELPDPYGKAKEILKQFNLWQYKDRHPDSISGGEKSRLGISDIVVNNTSVLLLDEPEFGLDPKSWEEITKLLEKLKSQGKTIIVITQDLEAAFFLSDRVTVIKDGKLVKVGFPTEIFKDEELLVSVGLKPLPFTPLLKNFPDKIKLSKKVFLENLRIK